MSAEERAHGLAMDLLRNGFGEEGERLVITTADGRDLGGWCLFALVEKFAAFGAAEREKGCPCRCCGEAPDRKRTGRPVYQACNCLNYGEPERCDCVFCLGVMGAVAAEREAGRREGLEEAAKRAEECVSFSGDPVAFKEGTLAAAKEIRALAASEAGRDGRGGEK